MLQYWEKNDFIFLNRILFSTTEGEKNFKTRKRKSKCFPPVFPTLIQSNTCVTNSNTVFATNKSVQFNDCSDPFRPL